MAKSKELILILDNIRSVYNVGAIFRTADAVGISKIYLSGITPAPKDRFGRPRQDLAKTALGSEKDVSWESVKSSKTLILKLKKQGFKIFAVEQSPKSLDYRKVKFSGKAAFVFGNEVGGLPKSVLNSADSIIEIPMRGKKESLNVSVAAAVVLFRILDI